MSIKKENLILIGALSVPLLVIIIVAVVIYLPNLFKTPTYNFVYAECSSCHRQISDLIDVKGDRVIVRDYDEDDERRRGFEDDLSSLDIYLYDVNTHVSEQIELEELQSYQINSSSYSPDGYVFEWFNEGNIFTYVLGDNDRGYVLRNKSQKIDLKINTRTYYHRIEFIGWIKK